MSTEEEKTIIVGNLPYELGEDDVRKEFEDFGEITEFKLPPPRHVGYGRNKKNKGLAIITYSKHEHAKNALAKNETFLGSRKIYVKFESQDKKDSRSQGRRDRDRSRGDRYLHRRYDDRRFSDSRRGGRNDRYNYRRRHYDDYYERYDSRRRRRDRFHYDYSDDYSERRRSDDRERRTYSPSNDD